MKYMFAALLSLMFVSTAFADDSVVRWDTIVGVITSPGVDNPVADIHAGATPWTTRHGQAAVDLKKGDVVLEVEGLVINGGTASGTPGAITSVVGTLVCNPGQKDGGGNSIEVIYDTTPVALSARGKAGFSGSLGSIQAPCNNPLFLIRIAQPAGAFGRWIATGAARSFRNQFFFEDE
jgi:hypothetical protein